MKFYTLLLSIVTALCAKSQDGIFYVSLNEAVKQGQYDGVLPIDSLKRHGNFGLGSTHRIGSELVMINDTAFSITAVGGVSIMISGTLLPFAAIKSFKAEKSEEINGPIDLSRLENLLDSLIGTNRFAAIRITGSFDSISYRCYYPQEKPYPPIDKASNKVFDSTRISGTIVGFFTPNTATVLNNPRYHFHFINQRRSSGGHVISIRIDRVKIEIDYADRLTVALPDPVLLKDFDLDKKDEMR